MTRTGERGGTTAAPPRDDSNIGRQRRQLEPVGCHEHESKSAGRGETAQFVAADRRMQGAGGELTEERAQVVAASRRGRSSQAEAVGGWVQTVQGRSGLGFSARGLR